MVGSVWLLCCLVRHCSANAETLEYSTGIRAVQEPECSFRIEAGPVKESSLGGSDCLLIQIAQQVPLLGRQGQRRDP
ncbi:MAG: hypothetical protein ACRERS_04000 [Methylococcales bacterium]